MSMAIQKRNLRVLICSGNLGNARPDEMSIAAWLPQDGNYNEVVSRPVYPLPSADEQKSLYKDLGLQHFRVQHGAGGQDTFKNIDEEVSDDYFDIIVIGLQEATFDVEDDDPMVLLPVIQPLISKTVMKGLASGVDAMNSMMKSKDHTKTNGMEWLAKADSKVLGELLRQHLPSYNFAVRFQRGEMRLEILTHVLLQVETLSVKAQNTGIGINGVMNGANKGGIVAELLVEGSTRLTFCTAHLQAHEGVEKYVDRCRMAAHIFEGTADTEAQIPLDLSLKSHIMFFLGDLNFRTDLEGDYEKDQQMQLIRQMVDKEQWRELNEADELFRALRNKDCLMGFQTPPCYFPPTFKVERLSGYVYKDNRRPSYTDRILWRTLQKLEQNVMCVAYEPIRDFVTSDHKPIRGAFEIGLNERIQPRPPLNKKRMTGSTKNLFQLSTKTMGGNGNDALHLFFRDIKCGLKKRSFAPDPYVSFLSFPCHLVQAGESKWQKMKGRLKMGASLRLETQSTSDGSKMRTVQGFPRTKKLRGTHTPVWDEEIHLVVKTHDQKGKPFDMTGSILMITVLDHTPSVESKVIGSIPINLAALCMSTQEEREGMEATNWHDSFGRVVGDRTDAQKDETTDVRTLRMKQPLVRNGRQTGWISLTIDMWWLDLRYQKEGKVAPSTSDLKKQLLQRSATAKAKKRKPKPTSRSPTTMPADSSSVASQNRHSAVDTSFTDSHTGILTTGSFQTGSLSLTESNSDVKISPISPARSSASSNKMKSSAAATAYPNLVHKKYDSNKSIGLASLKPEVKGLYYGDDSRAYDFSAALLTSGVDLEDSKIPVISPFGNSIDDDDDDDMDEENWPDDNTKTSITLSVQSGANRVKKKSKGGPSSFGYKGA